jgi:DNA-binding MarR family transcriptional regulator
MLADKQVLVEMPATLQAFDTETATRLRTAIGRLSRRLRGTAAAREAGLTPTATSIFLGVDRNGRVRLAELAEWEGINPTLLSRVIAKLVDDGLLERTSDEGDRRAAWVAVTAAGHRLAERMRRERTEAVNAALGELSERDRKRIESALPALELLAEQLKGRRP